MNKKAVQWLYHELPGLVKQGVLSQDAADKLQAHYGDSKSDGKKWFVIILCSILGAVLIGLGIISLFAHNWEDLSRPTRAVLSILPLLAAQALAVWVMINRPDSQPWKEGTATFLSLMVGSSIALISQTYNIPGDTSTFIMTWMLLILPLAYLMGSTIPAAIYVVGVSSWAGHFWNDPFKAFLFWPLLALIVPHFIWALKQERYAIRSAILAFVMAVGICVGANLTLGRTWPGSWIVIHSSLITFFYLLSAWEFEGITTNWQKPFRIIGGIGVFGLMFMGTFQFTWDSLRHVYYDPSTKMSEWTAIPDHLLTFLFIAGAMLMTFQFAKRQDWMRTLFGALPFLALFGYAFAGQSALFPALLFNLLLLATSLYRSIIGMRSNNLGMVNTGLFMLSALVLARFFDSGINFIFKGLLFIVIGVGFLITNLVILRRKGGAA